MDEQKEKSRSRDSDCGGFDFDHRIRLRVPKGRFEWTQATKFLLAVATVLAAITGLIASVWRFLTGIM